MKYCVAIGSAVSPAAPLPLGGDFPKTMREARKLGYDAVEIHTPEPDALDTRAISGVCAETGLFVATLGTGMIYGKHGLHLMETDDGRRQTILDMVKKYIDIAAQIGSKVTIGSIKGNVPAGADRARRLEILGACLRHLSAYAVEKGVFLLLEATNRYENNVINTGRDAREMIEQYGLQNTQALMDSYHINIEEASIENCLLDAAPYVGHIHFADNTRRYPGSGAFCFGRFCDAILRSGYDGVVSVEAFPLPDAMTAARESILFFRKHFG